MTKSDQLYDILIIGGGINGCGIAADAAMRGLKVCLVEKGDLASQTSSNSSKLIHGGLRYLEQFDFSLVKKALDERSTLMKIAPHLVKPLPFFIPYHQSMRPRWLIRLGLFLYDHLSRRNTLPNSSSHKRQDSPQSQPYFAPLKASFRYGFSYYDAQTNDTRLTIANAQQARRYGAHILPYHSFISAQPNPNSHWQVTIQTSCTHPDEFTLNAKAIVNAAGPWVNQINALIGSKHNLPINWVKGSHIIVKQLYEGNHAYLLQNDDKRIIFMIPYYQYTMIGTTDVAVDNIDHAPAIDDQELSYLIELTKRYLNNPVNKEDVIGSWSGIRPLIGHQETKAQNMSRDYQLLLTEEPLPLLSIYGGKITTYRQLAKEGLSKLSPYFPTMGACISDKVTLPGSNIPEHQWDSFYQTKRKQYHWLEQRLFDRYITNYGSLVDELLNQCEQIGDLGTHFGDHVYLQEVQYLQNHEWVKTVEDLLRRISDIGLTLSKDTIEKIRNYLDQYCYPGIQS